MLTYLMQTREGMPFPPPLLQSVLMHVIKTKFEIITIQTTVKWLVKPRFQIMRQFCLKQSKRKQIKLSHTLLNNALTPNWAIGQMLVC